MSSAALLEVEDLTLHRGGNRILDHVTLSLAPGETLALVGESGAGKSTIATALMGLLGPKDARIEGHARLEGQGELLGMPERRWSKLRGRRLSMIFQDAGSALNPCFTVGRQLVTVLRRNLGLSRTAARARALELFERVGINDAEARLSAYPHQLSGGMQQRVMVAIALACNPDLLFADEPTSALDVTIQAQIIRLILDETRTRGASCIFVLHDLALASQSCDRIVVLYAGQVVESGVTAEILEAPRHPYTAQLKSCVLEIGTRDLDPPEGSVGSYAAMPKGCRFARRCPRALPRCAEERPPLVPAPDGDRALACWNPL
ncbi:peptide/nickel transport system ATP-binding protein/oligopeptide transport system ATP-binding protein [Palleronia aestuarii]|uniref:Peptide/nickel transport system ATP-binding protein/oligopeptide transport system ATP-binding protein n=1 Tax=Palleronia aestuarii TaxID=568105 RepID=A0A2W7PZH7_9RHOB|nr:ABC transporter ATP-binding protein [Palleronia aestuarii]PZX14939.1 peptide/nickel transport system ATP-binding protein/oligopeptide transport system ATP-binding protein [Palleronia aestuarii]